MTKKRIVTPSSAFVDKENNRPNDVEDNDDSFMLNKPNLTFAIEESIEEDDSEILVAPTPSILPDDDGDQPTVTFQNISRLRSQGRASAGADQNTPRASTLNDRGLREEEVEEEEDGDITIMTERGRRAISEEVTGRFSRYSFGSIRMSDFGSELEIRRESNKFNNLVQVGEEDYIPLAGDDSFDGGETENLRKFQQSPIAGPEDDTIHASLADDETFRLELPSDEEEANAQEAGNGASGVDVVLADSILDPDKQVDESAEDDPDIGEPTAGSRRQTLLESATSQAQTSRRKRLKLTRHGTIVPSLPSSLVKRVVLDSYEKLGKKKPKLGRDHMKALEQATEWFLEQAGEDLAAYSSHGRRKKRVDTDDVLLLMQRQRVLSGSGELQQMAKQWLPREVLEGVDLPEEL